MSKEQDLSDALNNLFNSARGAIQEVGNSIEDAIANFLLPGEEEVTQAQAKARSNFMDPSNITLTYKDVFDFREDHEGIPQGEETHELISLEGYVVNRRPGANYISVEGSEGTYVVRVMTDVLIQVQRDSIPSLELSIPLMKNGDKILVHGFHKVNDDGYDVIDAYHVMQVLPSGSCDDDDELTIPFSMTRMEREWIEREAAKPFVHAGGATSPAVTIIQKLNNALPARGARSVEDKG